MTQDILEQMAGADILIVDDTPDNIRFLSSLLTRQGYKVRKALNGQMALIAVKTLTPDLILLDINMPEMDGYEVCRRLKADDTACSVPVIFLSAWDDAEDKVKAFQVGGVDYITKPFQFAEVLIRIENQLTLQKLQKQLQAQNSRLKQAIKTLSMSPLELIQQETMTYLSRLAIGVARGMDQPLAQISNYLSHIGQTLPMLKQCMQPPQDGSTAVELPNQLPNQFPDQLANQFFNQSPEQFSEQFLEQSLNSLDDQLMLGAIDANGMLSSLDQATQAMQANANQMQSILLALHSLAQCNTSNLRSIDIHEAIDRMLVLLQSLLVKSDAAHATGVVKDYGVVPSITCYVNLFNQVLFNLLSQAIDELTCTNNQTQTGGLQPELRIKTELSDRETVLIHIQINDTATATCSSESLALAKTMSDRPADSSSREVPLPIGIAICQRIVEETHQGRFTHRTLQQGREFVLEMPLHLQH